MEQKINTQLSTIEKSINPPGGGSESTSLVSRFSVNYKPENLNFPVKAVMLSPADIVMVLCDSFYNDLKPVHDLTWQTEQINTEIEAIKSNPNAAFLVVKPYSFIPSYFSDTMAACPATQFFASVLLEGKLSFIEDKDKKADILNALMKKFQNEDSFEKIACN